MSTSDELRDGQKNLWSSAAKGWDKWDGWFDSQTQALNDWFCEASGARPGHQVLDLACGAGQPARTIAKRIKPGGKLIATDISSDMLEVSAKKVREEGLDNVELKEMGAESITFPDATFDAVTCRFGLMFCPEPERAAKEIRRVLKPGGRFAVAVWDVPAKNPFFTAIQKPLAEFGAMPPPDPKAPGVFRLAPPGELEGVLRAGGFSDVTIESLPLTVEYESLELYWQIQTDLAAPLKAALQKLAPADVTKLRDAVFAALTPFVHDGRVRLGATPLRASGKK